jgi:hypothetical protein
VLAELSLKARVERDAACMVEQQVEFIPPGHCAPAHFSFASEPARRGRHE